MIGILHTQGWHLQRRIRSLCETSFPVERLYNASHTGSRSAAQSVQHYADMAGPKGLKHIYGIFTHLAEMGTQYKIGVCTPEDSLPIDAKAEFVQVDIEEDSTFFAETMAFAVPLSGLLLRRALWRLEGLPGFHTP